MNGRLPCRSQGALDSGHNRLTATNLYHGAWDRITARRQPDAVSLPVPGAGLPRQVDRNHSACHRLLGVDEVGALPHRRTIWGRLTVQNSRAENTPSSDVFMSTMAGWRPLRAGRRIRTIAQPGKVPLQGHT